MFAYLLDAFSGPGAVFMWAITAVLAFGLAVFLERTWTLRVRFRIRERALRESLESGDLDAAIEAAGNSPIRDVLRAGVEERDAEAAWDRMGAEASRAERLGTERVSYLATIGNIATMLGLLGTVYGLIIAFSALGDTAAGERAVRLSEGISTAMATTAYGLITGIPALLAHAWLEGGSRALLAHTEEAAGLLAAHRRSQ